MKGGEDRDSWRCFQDHLLRPSTTAASSTLHHPRHASVHLLFFQDLAASDLIDAQLHLRVEPAFFSEQTVHSLGCKVLCGPARACGEADQRCCLTVWELKV